MRKLSNKQVQAKHGVCERQARRILKSGEDERAIADESDPIDPKNRNLELRNEKLELEISRLKKDSISREEHDAAIAALGAEIDSVLKQKVVEEIPVNCPGMPADELAKFCEGAYSAVIEKWKAFTEKWKF